MAIDYSLFIVSRHREEIQRRGGEDALGRTMATAGLAILFSGLTVAVGLLGLYSLRIGNLGSIGLCGTLVVFFAVLYGLTFLPALLAVLGPRLDAWRVPLPRLGANGGRGFWVRLTTVVMNHPWRVLLPVAAASAPARLAVHANPPGRRATWRCCRGPPSHAGARSSSDRSSPGRRPRASW